jgi:hypothetical protein
MAKGSNIVHQYFKKELEDGKILVKVNPLLFTGTEITVSREGEIELRDLEFDESIFEDLAADEFEEVNPMEFNLYLSGLAK